MVKRFQVPGKFQVTFLEIINIYYHSQLMFMSLPNPYVEALGPSVLVSGGGAFER